MKRLTFSVVMTAVLGLAAYTLADAQAHRRGPGFGPPAAFQEDGRPGGPGRGFGPRGGGPLSSLRGIDLTDEQKEQIRTIREEARQAQGGQAADDPAGRGPRRGPGRGGPEFDLHRQLQAELFADSPDQQKIAALQQQLIAAHSTRLAHQSAIEQKIAQVLTAEQREQVRQRLAEGGRSR
jgi:protein CpxP